MSSAAPGTLQKVPLSDRIKAFEQLGELFALWGTSTPWPGHGCGLNKPEYDAFEAVVIEAQARNAWFTDDNVRHMLRSLAEMLDHGALHAWLKHYQSDNATPVRTVGVITAGNIPLVGFHDLACVLLSGHRAELKPSSDDAGLLAAVLEVLRLLAPDLAAQATIVEGRLAGVDALIATGSDNTARYFEHYFGHLPRIVRKNRTSVAVLDGSETEEELQALGEDLFRYFGLGCRNVGKLHIPHDFDLDRLFKAIFKWGHLAKHNKWANNYDYHKAIWLMDRVPLLENGFVLLKEDAGLHSPLGSIYYERYTDRSHVTTSLAKFESKLQCVVGHGHLAFGHAQCPGLQDYADGVDTMRFLLELGR